jgi:AI-2 transport protein TqsA
MKNTDIYAKTNNFCLVFLTIIGATVTLIYMRPVLIPLIFSIFAYALLTPLVTKIRQKTKAPKGLAVFFALALLFVVLTVLVFVIIISVENFVVGAPKYKESLTGLIQLVENKLSAFDINLELGKLTQVIQSAPFLAFAQKIGGQLLSFLGNLFLVFIFTMFMMTGETRTQKKGPLLKEVLDRVSSYISTKALLSVATGILVWLVLVSFGVELALIFGLLTILFNFIPTIGSILAVALPLPIVLLQYQLGFEFFAILALTGTIQFSIGNVLEPKIMGDSMDLHPITVLGCLIFWGMVWGIAGMFLAVPITAVLKIVFRRIDATRELSEIMAGRIPSRS